MKLYQVDAFTHQPFSGNPAGVCLLETLPSDAWMQGVASEMNLPETAFLIPEPDTKSFRLRWFTPETEVGLCGHATLASAHILWEESILSLRDDAVFHTRSGILTASKQGEWIEMDFPLRPMDPVAPNPALAQALGVDPIFTGQYVTEGRHLYLMEVRSDQEVRELSPDFAKLKASDASAVIVTAVSSQKDYDFVSRFFAPALGIDEDPVTGSAHCSLAPYWAFKLGKEDLTGFQASRRGGFVQCKPQGDRVILRGRAVTIFRGALAIPPG